MLGRWTAVCTPERLNVDTHNDWVLVEQRLALGDDDNRQYLMVVGD
jgi:hypothetical protein